MWLRQMAQLSTTMSQAQRATAFHWICQLCGILSGEKLAGICTFLTSNFFFSASSVFFAGASLISTSAMMRGCVELGGRGCRS